MSASSEVVLDVRTAAEAFADATNQNTSNSSPSPATMVEVPLPLPPISDSSDKNTFHALADDSTTNTLKSTANDGNDDDDLDFVFNEIGEFNVYQLCKYGLMLLPIALSAIYAIGFIVTGSTLDYRCVCEF